MKQLIKNSDDIIKFTLKKGDSALAIDLKRDSLSFSHPLTSVTAFLYTLQGEIIDKFGLVFNADGTATSMSEDDLAYSYCALDGDTAGTIELYVKADKSRLYPSGQFMINCRLGFDIAGYDNEVFLSLLKNPLLCGNITEDIFTNE